MEIKTKIFILSWLLCLDLLAKNANQTSEELLERQVVENFVQPGMEFIKVYESNDSKPHIRTILDDYKICRNNLKNHFVNIGKVDALAISKDYAISKSKPEFYQVYNPFFDIFIIHQENGFSPSEPIKECGISKIASITNDNITHGTMLENNNERGKVDFGLLPHSLIVTPCCQVLGISMSDNEFLPLTHLYKLTNRKDAYDGYLGASFYQDGNKVFIDDVDFNIPDLQLCPNDQIISLNGVDIRTEEGLNRLIMSSKKGDLLKIALKRGNEIVVLQLKTLQKPSYELNSLSYLEKLGAKFNDNLTITSIFNKEFAQKNGLFVGDKIMQINFKQVKNSKDVKNVFLYSQDEAFYILFTRKDFQFFVHLKRSDIPGGLIALKHCPKI